MIRSQGLCCFIFQRILKLENRIHKCVNVVKIKAEDISVYLHVDTFPTFCPEVKGMVSVVVLPRSSVINAVESYAACQREQLTIILSYPSLKYKYLIQRLNVSKSTYTQLFDLKLMSRYLWK